MKVPFHAALKRVLIEAFSRDSLSPDQVALHVAKAIRRPSFRKDHQELLSIINERQIRNLVHFTPIQNVAAICRYGLIPREHLEHQVLKLALGPIFPDLRRLEGMPEYNCLSISQPNYKMFYSKRHSVPSEKWSVIIFDAKIIAGLWAEFCPTNAATRNAPRFTGGSGLRKQFACSALRDSLGLNPMQPTDPQAEILCDSVIPSSSILSIFVEHVEDTKHLSRFGIDAEVEPRYFNPRHDHQFWHGKRIIDLPEYGAEILGNWVD